VSRLRHAIASSPAYQRLRGIIARSTLWMRRVRVIVVYRMNLLEPLTPYAARVPIRVEIARDEALLRRLAALKDNPDDDSELYVRRAGRGQLCFVAWIDDQPVGINWLAFGEELDEDRMVRMADDEVYGLDAFTVPEWRGNAIHTALLARMLVHAKEAGFRTAYTQVSATTRRSRKTHERLKWTVSGRILHVTMPFGRPAYMRRLTGSQYPIVHMYR
jgi:GNAT superfamily N-acetyltransferase